MSLCDHAKIEDPGTSGLKGNRMKGKESVIGMVVGVLLSVAAGLLGLQADAIKAGVCGAPAAAQVAK